MARIKEIDASEEQPTIKVKKAKLAVRSIVEWKRIRKKEDEEEEEQAHNEKINEQPSYSSRLLMCMRCTTKIETKDKQLHTKEGFRGIYCPTCKKQDRCLFNLCQCEQIWHQCSIHRVDPGTHNTTKGTLRKKKKSKQEERKNSSSRRAPVTNAKEVGGKGEKKSKRGIRKRQQPKVLHTKFVASKNPPRAEMVERIREKQQKKQKNELEKQKVSGIPSRSFETKACIVTEEIRTSEMHGKAEKATKERPSSMASRPKQLNRSKATKKEFCIEHQHCMATSRPIEFKKG